MEIFSNSHFWALIAFIIIILVLYKKVKFHITNFLNNKIEDIKTEISNSEDNLASTLYLLKERKVFLEESTEQLEKEVVAQKLKIEATYETLIKELKNINILSKKNIDNYYKAELAKLELETYNKFITLVNVIIAESGIENIDHNTLIEQSINNIKQQI